MILSYSHTQFVPAIIQHTKIHTLRKRGRWRAGMTIQHWLGSPRNPYSTPPPLQFYEGMCDGVEKIRIWRTSLELTRYGFRARIGGADWSDLDDPELAGLAKNDGLTPEEFRDWFLPAGAEDWWGEIVHFTPFRYAS